MCNFVVFEMFLFICSWERIIIDCVIYCCMVDKNNSVYIVNFSLWVLNDDCLLDIV